MATGGTAHSSSSRGLGVGQSPQGEGTKLAHVTETQYGWLTPALAYLFSYLGCLLGLKATARARMIPLGGARARWLLLAAWAIGGTGIWVMHFVAMVGFGIGGSQVRFNLNITLASWLAAIVIVGFGLFIVGYTTRPTAAKIVVAGTFMGVGVAAMHYTGMAAMNIDGTTTWDMRFIIASVVIAVVASIVALWFTVSVRRTGAVLGASAIAAFAVCAMHYTGMAAMKVHLHSAPSDVHGWQAVSFLVPIFIFMLVVVVVLGYAMLNSVSEEDAAALDSLEHRLAGASGAPVSRPSSFGFRVDHDDTRGGRF
jgi:NO-binding membrane sensor protein with MHYT domain